MQDIAISRIAKYQALLINYGHIDFAYHLGVIYPAVYEINPEIRHNFKPMKYRKLRSIKKSLVFQLDKILALALHLRKTNCDNQDSDRCWPVR